jgi:arylsulfatase A-like enzyme
MRYVNPDMANRYPYHSFVGDSIWNVVSEYKMDDSPSPGMVAYNRAVYDAEVNFVDDEIERLLSYVREAGLDENTIVVFTSDHGEQFYDHGGRLHSKTLYNEEIRVPLIIRAPGYEPRKAKERIRALDIYRTLVDLAALPSRFAGAETAIEIERQTMGMSLVPLMRGDVDDASYSDEVFSSVDIDGVRKEAYLKGAWKLINNIERGDSLPRPPQELYRISQDPRELTDLSSEDDAQLRRLTMKEREGRKTMAARKLTSTERKPLDEAEVEKLKALGYINR